LTVVIVVLALFLPVVQTGVAHRLTNSINATYDTGIRIGKTSVAINGSIVLKDVIARDHHQDTLVYLQSLATNSKGVRALLAGELDFELAKIEGLKAKIIHYPGEEQGNLTQFIQKLQAQKKADAKTRLLKIKSLQLTEGLLFWQSATKINSSPIALSKLTLDLKDFYVFGPWVVADILAMTFATNSLEGVQSLSGRYASSACGVTLRDFEIQTNESLFKGQLTLNYPEGGWTDFKTDTSIDLELDTLLLGIDLQKQFVKETYPRLPLSGKMGFSGTVDQFALRAEQLNWGESQWSGLLEAQQILDTQNRQFEVHLDQAHLTVDDFQFLLAQNPDSEAYLPYITPFSDWEINGQIAFASDQLISNLNLSKDNENVQLSLETNGSKSQPTYAIDFAATSLNFQHFLPDSPWGRCNAKIKLSGTGTSIATAQANWSLRLEELHYQQHVWEYLSMEGNLAEGTLNTRTQLASPMLNGKLISTHSIAEKNSRHTFVGTVEQLMLGKSNLTDTENPIGLTAKIVGTLRGNSIPQLVGNLSFEDITLSNGTQSTTYGNFVARLARNQQERIIEIPTSELVSGSIRGAYRLQQLPSLLRATIDRAFPVFTTSKTQAEGTAFVDLIIGSPLLKGLDPSLVSEEPIVIAGKLSDQDPTAYLSLETPVFKTPKIDAKNLRIYIAPEADQESILQLDRLEYNDYVFENLVATSSLIDQKIGLQITAQGGEQRNDHFQLFFEQEQIAEKQIFKVKPSTIRFRSNDWQINPTNDPRQALFFDLQSGTFTVEDLRVRTADYALAFSGFYQQANDFELGLVLDQVELAAILPQPKNFHMEGTATSRLRVKRSPSENLFLLNGIVEDLKINDAVQGTFKINSQGNTKINAYAIDFSLVGNTVQTLTGLGNLTFTQEEPRLDLDMTFQEFDLVLLSHLGGDSLTDFKGSLDGTVNLYGPVSNLFHQGNLILNQAEMFIPYTQTGLIFDPRTTVVLTKQKFLFGNTTISTAGAPGSALLNGSISHTNFKNWSIDFNFETAGIEILNKPQTPEALFYGKGIFAGNIALTGSFKNPLLALSGKTNSGTSIKIPWIDSYTVADTSFINFVAKNQTTTNAIQGSENEVNGLDVQIELEVTPEADVEIVIDEVSKSYLAGLGTGKLLMDIDTKGTFNMWGDFTTQEGIYNFKNLGVIDKKFSLKPGGTIVWEGDPLGAQMRMEAVYQVPGGANPALLLDNPDFNRKIPTEVLIRLEGDLLKPENPSFEIDFPNTGGTVVTELQYRLNDPQRAQLQAISLLSQGIFINDVGVSVQGLTNNLYEKASDVFSSLLGDENEKFKVGVNYLQGDKSSPVEIVSEDRLGLTLSTQLSDRILINGKIGVPVGGVEETLIVGDVQIDFILNDDGSLRAKVFNKENEFRYFGDELGYTQGMGLSYQVDFNTFSDLIAKIISKEKRNTQTTPVFQNNPPNIEFVKKQQR